MKKTILKALVALALTGPAAAGDWTGFYGGAQLGYSSGDISASTLSLEGNDYGLHAGYNYDMGNWVIGGELAFSAAKHTIDAFPILETSELGHLKLRAGYDLGQGLVYGVAGLAHVQLDSQISPVTITESGSVFGLGYEHKVSDRISVGAEYLHSQFDNVDNSGADIDYDTFQARVSFHF